ncbi:SAG family member (sag4) [Eimeria tenella]|uniref:SAG family member (Sag4) n=1 Tax=Eimeria tenella TaxID=5802 RepID=Q70CD9_EIMTE|nr:SAG family member (sag4) [Eimeria tenella]AET50800.1 hypothetical protein [Eimeria tenella]CAE52296.1 surface antigen 4 [Eimeria tenella]CDJ41980.1 SAG family member (sag4) [Eimeria tenella]|eukprot:XP_013232730.1 SAG family member (sag4) [Eimeria tenella]
MARVAFFSLVFVPLVFNQAIAQQQAATPDAKKLNCLEAMNALRTAAGLAEFKEASTATQILPEKAVEKDATVKPGTLWEEICPKVRGTEPDNITEAKKLTGTFAYYPVADGKKDCNAAVEYWKGGFSLFKNEIPPEFTEANKTTVYNDRAVSFVALYNPKPDPVVSCVLLQCPTATSPGVPGAGRRLSSSSTTVEAVICLTNPAALTENAAPFKEDEWKKIVEAISGNKSEVSPVGPSVALVSATAIAVFALF